jgi:CheY-like chemotaxis protein
MKSKVTWIHLSDWHQGDTSFYREKVREALEFDLSHLQEQIHPAVKNIDFVIFSGDIADHGASEEYQEAKKQLFEPVMKAAGLENCFDRLFIVPGNHDVDWNVLKLLDQELYKKDQETLEEWFRQEKFRNILLTPLANYDEFTRGLFGGDEEPARGYLRTIQAKCGRKISVMGVNTAWLSGLHRDIDSKVDDKGWLRVVESQFFSIQEERQDEHIRIVVMHHPPEWFNQNIEKIPNIPHFDPDVIENRLMKQCHFLLHGHNHKSRARLIVDHISDCVTISAGSLFAKANRTEIPPNGYNIIQLNFTNGQGTVFIRRYDDGKSCFVPDESSTSSKPQGQWTFKLQKGLDQLAPLDGCEILILDDDENFLAARSEILRTEGKYIVYKASSTSQAEQLLESCPIDLALIDVCMDDRKRPRDHSGIMFKDTVVKKGVPAIMMTVYEKDSRAAREAFLGPYPASDYVYKKDDVETFMKASEKVLRSSI